MRVNGAGYNDHMYNREELLRTVKRIAQRLPAIMAETGADSIAVQGKSGIAVAFALQLYFDVPVMVVRKPDESSHGNDVEGNDEHDYHKYLVLDDFVASGTTAKRIIDQTDEYWGLRRRNGEQPVCVGIVEYKKFYGQGGHLDSSDDRYNVMRYGMGELI